MRALVVLDGDPLGTGAWLAALATTCDIVIAADGGAARLHTAGGWRLAAVNLSGHSADAAVPLSCAHGDSDC